MKEKKNARQVVCELDEIIKSDMEDDEIAQFIEEKLDSSYSANEGEAREWLIEIRDYLDQKSMHYGRNRKTQNPLWIEPMEEASVIFETYHTPICDKVDDDDELLNLYLTDCGADIAKKAVQQLTEIIDSEMDDDEVEDYIYHKLKSRHYAQEGKSRAWLIRIRDYLTSKINNKEVHIKDG